MWHNGKHPMWSIVRMVIVFCGAALLLQMTATNFDSGELRAAGGTAIVSVVFDYVKRLLVTA